MSAAPIMEGAVFTYPEQFLLSPFWNNPLIKRNARPICHRNYPLITTKVKIVADFFCDNSTTMLTLQEFNDKYSIDFDPNQYV